MENSCEECFHNKTKIKDLEERIKVLVVDLYLESKEKEKLQRKNNSLLSEIEELSKSLFEQAQKMVFDETEKRSKLEKKQEKILEELHITKINLEEEKTQVKTLKEIFEKEKTKEVCFKNKNSLFLPDQKKEIGGFFKRDLTTISEILLNYKNRKDICIYFENIIESNEFKNFQEFVNICEKHKKAGKKLTTIFSSSFLKKIFEYEFISVFKDCKIQSLRKLLYSILENNFTIEKKDIINEFECFFCLKKIKIQQNKYFKIDFHGNENKHMDIICHKRFIIVCDFFYFLRNIFNGVFNKRTKLSLYLEFSLHRRSLFYYSIGQDAEYLFSLVDDLFVGKERRSISC